MQNWFPSLKAESGPKYAMIADAIAGAIRSGELRPGERLPAQRDLAMRLGVDLTTVTRAYGLAAQAGLIEGAGKLGSFVRNDAASAAEGETTSQVGMNVPPQPAFSLLPEAVRTGTATLLRAGRHSPILQYQPSAGHLLERAQAAASLSDRDIPTAADEIAITAGAQNALHGIVATTLRPGDRICCAGFLYPGMIALAKRHGIALVAVASDKEGMLPDALEAALKGGAGAVYLTPTNDNPTTATMSMVRRRAIAGIVRHFSATLIEDDAYGLLPSVPPPPISSLIPERSWYVAGTSKIISPIIRVAHVRAPSAEAAAALAKDIGETAVMAPPLNAALVTAWLRDGSFNRLVAGVRAEAVARQRIVARCLTGLAYDTNPEGYHLWLDLEPNLDPVEIVAGVAPLGLSIVAGAAFAVAPQSTTSRVRISIGGALDHARLERALLRVRELAERR
jgi:DNA-binding transcriptional MocR family regulator